MYLFNYEINLVYILVLANTAVILALALVLLELREVRKLRRGFDHMFGHYEELIQKDTQIFWKELEELKGIASSFNGKKSDP